MFHVVTISVVLVILVVIWIEFFMRFSISIVTI